MTLVAAPHGSGSNHANAGPADLPIEPRRRESVDDFRARMEAKRTHQRRFMVDTVKGHASRGLVAVDEDLEAAKFEEPNLELDEADEPAGAVPAPRQTPRPTPKPTPAARPVEPDAATRQRLAAVTAYVDGDSLSTIAESTGKAVETIRRWLLDAGVTLRPQGSRAPTSHVDVTALAAAYREGAGLTELGRTHGISPTTVSRLLRSAGVKIRPAGPRRAADPKPKPDPAAPSRYVDDAERALIVQAYEAGESAPDIAERHHRNPATIRAALRSAGVTLRDDRARNHGQRKTTDDDDPELVAAFKAAYEAGQTVHQIAENVPGATSSTFVHDVLIRAGVTMRRNRSSSALTDELLARILALKEEGLSDAAVGERIGFAQPTVSKWLRRHRATLTGGGPAPAAQVATSVRAQPEPDGPTPESASPLGRAPLVPAARDTLAGVRAEAREVISGLLDAAAALASVGKHVGLLVELGGELLTAVDDPPYASELVAP